MRSFRHWTPGYIFNRINELIYQIRYPAHPWLTKTANIIITAFLKKSDIGLEFGSGRSTIYFAPQVSFLTSVEHNVSWYNKTKKILNDNNITNVTYLLCPEDVDESQAEHSAYVKVSDNYPPDSLDFVLVDGIYRAACANAVLDKIRPGGLLILDNANRYLPGNSISPDSRSLSQGPASAEWASFLKHTANWRRLWTSSGVTDTALYLKPCPDQPIS